MLRELRLKDWALVEEASVELSKGLNVVTGETGAGKSLLVGALQALLGDRARAEVVRSGAERAELEAVFDVSDEPAVRERLLGAGLPSDEELLVRRVVDSGGKGRAYLNGRLAIGSLLREVMRGLVDLSSQHEHHRLADREAHLEFLDLYAGAFEEREQMEAAYRELDRATRALGSADRSLEERSAAEEIIRFQLREIQAVDPKHDEIAELSVERERLRHAGRIQETAALAEEALYSRDAAVSGVLARQSAALASLGHLDPRLADAARRLDSARVELEDVARDLSRVAQGADVDPDRLATLEERLALLTRLARKHGGDLDGVLAARARLAEELSGLVDHEARIGGLRRAFEVALEGAGRVARSLSQRRRASARTLGDRIGAELADLGMGEARVEVEVTRANGAVDDERTVDGARLGPTGIDRAEILLAPNPGEPARPLRRIASGGELSRAMLAVKTVLTGLGPTGTYVFDEVDAGVGGAAAEVVGRKLLGISRRHQVVCVTHLPQVASLADTHFVVEKRRAAGRTVSEVRRLGERERRAEIARMLGGLRVTRKTRAAADEMIRLGRRASP